MVRAAGVRLKCVQACDFNYCKPSPGLPFQLLVALPVQPVKIHASAQQAAVHDAAILFPFIPCTHEALKCIPLLRGSVHCRLIFKEKLLPQVINFPFPMRRMCPLRWTPKTRQ